MSAHRNRDNDEARVVADVDLVQLRERFDRQLPKYGFLWRSMANARLAAKNDIIAGKTKGGDDKENVANPPSKWPLPAATGSGKYNSTSTGIGEEEEGASSASTPPKTSLIDAILNKQAVSLRIRNHELCGGDDCDCADPILEIIENEDASVYDVNVDEELADSTDDDESAKSSTAFQQQQLDDNVVDVAKSSSPDHVTNASLEDDSDDDDEGVVLVTRTPKKKTFIIDSDEEDDGSEEELKDDNNNYDELNGGNNDESSKSISTYGISSTSSRRTRTSNRLHNNNNNNNNKNNNTLKSKADDVDFIDDSDGDDDESEKEWLEISSTENEKFVPPKRPNTIVILSDDEEEAESSDDDDDEQSAFTISDDDSDSSQESDDSSIYKSRGGGSGTYRNPSAGGREATRKTIPRTKKPTSTVVVMSKRNNNSRSTFRKDATVITSRTFAEFNNLAFNNKLSSVEVNWSNKLNTTAGITRMRGKLGEKNAHTRTAVIELATKVIDDEERLRATLLHEMCHAAQWLVDGVHKPPHGSSFKKWAALSTRVIGDVEVTTTHDYQIVYKYAWACTASNCKVVIKRHSRSVDPTKHCCGRCKGKLVEIEVPGSKGDTATGGGATSYTAKKARKTSDFALFVKEQTSTVRNRLARELSCSPKEVAQSDVMKECGRLWRSRKTNAESSSSSAKVGIELDSVKDRLANMAL